MQVPARRYRELVTPGRVESACASVAGVSNLTSTSRENVSMVIIEFEDGTNLDTATTKLRDNLELTSLPDDCSDPTIMNINMDLMPVSIIALSGNDLADLQDRADQHHLPCSGAD